MSRIDQDEGLRRFFLAVAIGALLAWLVGKYAPCKGTMVDGRCFER